MAVQFVALALVWGASFLFMKVSLEGLSPAQVVLGRLVLGAAALNAIMLLSRRRWPRDPRLWADLAVVAALLCVLPFSLFAWAGQHIPSGLSSIYNATTPIMTMLLVGAVLPGERLGRLATAGVLLGALGVVVLAAPWTYLGSYGSALPLLAQLACLAATTSYGLAFVVMRLRLGRHGHDTLTLATVQVSIAALAMLGAAPWVAGAPMTLSPAVTMSMLALGGLGTGLAYVWNTAVLRAWGATAASTVTYLTPVVGVALGVLVLSERLRWHEPVGGALVVLGILVSRGLLVRSAARPGGASRGRPGYHGRAPHRPRARG